MTHLRDPDWSKFPSSMPREAVVRPTGERKVKLIAQIRNALARLEGVHE